MSLLFKMSKITEIVIPCWIAEVDFIVGVDDECESDSSCLGYSCDYWSYSCEELESSYGCDCTGCECPNDGNNDADTHNAGK